MAFGEETPTMIFLVHFRVPSAPSQKLRPTPRGGIGLVLKTPKAADTELLARNEITSKTSGLSRRRLECRNFEVHHTVRTNLQSGKPVFQLASIPRTRRGWHLGNLNPNDLRTRVLAEFLC